MGMLAAPVRYPPAMLSNRPVELDPEFALAYRELAGFWSL